jgi:hypothetical protein
MHSACAGAPAQTLPERAAPRGYRRARSVTCAARLRGGHREEGRCCCTGCLAREAGAREAPAPVADVSGLWTLDSGLCWTLDLRALAKSESASVRCANRQALLSAGTLPAGACCLLARKNYKVVAQAVCCCCSSWPPSKLEVCVLCSIHEDAHGRCRWGLRQPA